MRLGTPRLTRHYAAHPASKGQSITVRLYKGCTGRLLSWCITWPKRAICAGLAVMGCFITSHNTPSEHGGVVNEPLNW